MALTVQSPGRALALLGHTAL